MPERARMIASATSLHRLVLAHDALVQNLVQPQQLLAFALLQAGDRDAGPARTIVGDLVLGHHLPQQPLSQLATQLRLVGFQARSSSGSRPCRSEAARFRS